jgi:hypothetical protein
MKFYIHSLTLHDGDADIVRLIDYLAGRSSGQYTPNNPFWFKRNNPYGNIGPATVADSINNTFHPTFHPEEAVLGTSQYPIYPPVDISQTFTNPNVIVNIVGSILNTNIIW